MQDQAQKTETTTTTTPPPGRSSVDKLPAELREAVNRAVAKGATIDDITALIRAEGESCSRSAVGRYAKDMRGLMHARQEADRIVKLWMQAYGERPQDEMALVLIQSLRAMALATMEQMTEREEPVPMQELDRVTRVLKRIEDTDKLRLARERAAQKEAEAAAKAAETAKAAKPEPRKGLSPEAEALILAEVRRYPLPQGPVNAVPIEPWNPRESHFVPPNLDKIARRPSRAQAKAPASP